jgi:hypothetical protein
VNPKGITLTARPPRHAPDRARGDFFLTLTGRVRASGWIYATDDGTVYATIDRAPWQRVGRVTSRAALTPDWIARNAHYILCSF